MEILETLEGYTCNLICALFLLSFVALPILAILAEREKKRQEEREAALVKKVEKWIEESEEEKRKWHT